MMRSIAGFSGAALLVVASVSGCKTTPEAPPPEPDPTVAEVQIGFSDRTLTSFTATATASVANPRSVPLRIERVTYTLSARGRTLREGAYEAEVSVPASGTGQVAVPVAVEYSLATDEDREMFTGEAVPIVFNAVAHGRYDGETVELDVDRAARLRSPRLPAVKLDTPDGARRRVDEVHATFHLRVENDNPFEIRISSLDYVLEVEGNELRESRVGTRQRVPASGSYIFTIEQDLRTANVPQLADRMREDNRIEYRLHGELRVGDMLIPFDETDEIRFAGQS